MILNIVVRRGGQKDLKFMKDLSCQVLKDIPPLAWEARLSVRFERFRYSLYLRQGSVLVAESAGMPIGFVLARGNMIGHLFVLPEYRGIGCGGLLLHSMEIVIDAKYGCVRVNASPNAVSFYQRNGYAPARSVPMLKKFVE